MRLSRTSIQNAVAGVAVGALASSASAGLVYDLRWAGGSDTLLAGSTGTTATLELYARVSGTNGLNTDEGLSNTYIQILSTQVNGGAITSGGLTSTVLDPGFAEAGSRPGGATHINADNVLDWGTTATAAANTNFMVARNATVGGAVAGGTLGTQVDANTWEFKLATFTVDVSAINPAAGTTTFNVVQPNAKATVGAITYAVAKVDGATFNVTSSQTQGAYAGSSGATLIVPEPASIGLLGAAAVGLLGRRRK